MALTWTRYVPDHYDISAGSSSLRSDEVGKQPFPFMDLPVEIRLQVYKHYLHDRYSLSPAEIHEMVLDSHHRSKRPAEILQVSKAVNAEVMDLLQQENTLYLRVCWQDATFDGFVKTCLRAKISPLIYEQMVYEHMTHLQIEIYLPHEDRLIDIVYIWRNVQKLCYKLRKASYIQHLSIHFMENHIAAWSHCVMTIRLWLITGASSSDISVVSDLFRIVTNVHEVQIFLPDSLNDDKRLQNSRLKLAEEMTLPWPPGDQHQESINSMEQAIVNNEGNLKVDTGRLSQAKLDKSCGSGYWISESHLDIFEAVWPHRDYVSEWEYEPRSHYLGDEKLENAPLSHANPYRTEYHNEDLVNMFQCDY